MASFFVAALIASGQGTLIYDQQSATNGIATFGASINQSQPIGQAFTPSFASVGFVQLQLYNGFNLTNATLAVNFANAFSGISNCCYTRTVDLPCLSAHRDLRHLGSHDANRERH